MEYAGRECGTEKIRGTSGVRKAIQSELEISLEKSRELRPETVRLVVTGGKSVTDPVARSRGIDAAIFVKHDREMCPRKHHCGSQM